MTAAASRNLFLIIQTSSGEFIFLTHGVTSAQCACSGCDKKGRPFENAAAARVAALKIENAARLTCAGTVMLRAELKSPANVVLTRRDRAEISEDMMDWNRVEGNWKQAKGKIKEKWGQLTDDDLDRVDGQRDQLEGKIQERYGIAKDMVRKDVDDWLKSQH
jgi:uncharacterized protein YjbJ (UPF0337 family)